MFDRAILARLHAWADSLHRKPLVLRGARQVGKTVAVKMFAERFDRFAHVDLERPRERDIFRRGLPIQDVLQAILLGTTYGATGGTTLVFLDEIQGCPEAVESLRHFHELLPDVHVIAAGSLLEIVLHDSQISFPVGRVQQHFMYPLSFREFLQAIGATQAAEALDTVPFPSHAHETLLDLFHRYALVGGMPEVVDRYREDGEVARLSGVYDSLLVSYMDDVGKYARGPSASRVLRHCIETAPYAAGQRITFAGFGHSNYRSREVGEALRTLQRAMLIHFLYPSTSVQIPVVPDLRKSPRLQFLDTGLLNYFVGLQEQYFRYDDLHSFYKGIIAQHVVAQEIVAADPNTRKKHCFWVRQKSQSGAEVDFLIQHQGLAIPVEVKSGKAGRLRSLHQFVNRCPHKYAVRLYPGPLALQQAETPEGKAFHLLNLPYFLASSLHQHLDWMMEDLSR